MSGQLRSLSHRFLFFFSFEGNRFHFFSFWGSQRCRLFFVNFLVFFWSSVGPRARVLEEIDLFFFVCSFSSHIWSYTSTNEPGETKVAIFSKKKKTTVPAEPAPPPPPHTWNAVEKLPASSRISLLPTPKQEGRKKKERKKNVRVRFLLRSIMHRRPS